MVNKVLRSLPPRFDHLMITIEEMKNLETLEIEELQHSLEAHEYCMEDRKNCQEQALHARSQYIVKGKGNSGKSNSRNKELKEEKEGSFTESVKRKNHKSNTSCYVEKECKFDKKKVRCFNCQKLGHFTKECWKGEGAKNKPKSQKNKSHLAQEDTSNSEVVMLMTKTGTDLEEETKWYLDSGCSTHMT